MEKGDQAFRARNYAEALACYEKAIELSPGNKVAWNNKGLTLARLGRDEEAMDAYLKSIELDPHYNIPNMNLQRLRQRMERAYAADQDFRKAEGFLNDGEYDKAIIHYDQVLERHPIFPLALTNRGLAMLKMDEIDQAIGSFKKAAEFDPDYEPAQINLRVALERKKEIFVIYMSEGNKAMEEGRFEDALKLYEKAVSIGPRSSNAWTNKGMAQMALSGYQEAACCFEKALKLNPGNETARQYLDRQR